MKKIVALVLSLVMVLGLATTAMAADWGTIEYDLYKANDDDAWKQVVVKVFDAENEDGAGNIEYFKLKDLASDAVFPDEFVECKRAEAEYFLTLKDNDGVYKYLKTADYVEYNYTGKAFTNIGDECGQIVLNAKSVRTPVSKVEDGICGNCHLRITPQCMSDLKRDKLAVCDNCQGLVYAEDECC